MANWDALLQLGTIPEIGSAIFGGDGDERLLPRGLQVARHFPRDGGHALHGSGSSDARHRSAPAA